MRRSGILLPIFSLPGKYGIGSFSENSYKFIDFLKNAGQKYWQILPVGPTGYGDSPYQTFCSFAGNPYFISLEKLIKEGLLKEKEVDEVYSGTNQPDDKKVDYEMLYNTRFGLLRKAYEKALSKKLLEKPAFKKFCSENEEWLQDYCLFMAIKTEMGGASFTTWPKALRTRNEAELKKAEERLKDDIGFYKFIQFKFYEQWYAVKKYANDKGIEIIGDLPIYVAPDSADVWAHPELFQLTKDAVPKRVAGCPPDGFTPLGQLWGNPLYDWDYHEKTGYAWWISRLDKCRGLYDIIRIDHFRGFDEYYSVPGQDTDATRGKWVKGPGMKLFNAIKESLGEIRIIAEDLGYTTDSVRQLVKDSGFPNMKIMEFAFYESEDGGNSEFLPFNHYSNCVVYTGTHDNETLIGWLKNTDDNTFRRMTEYIGYGNIARTDYNMKKIAQTIIRVAQNSVADYCIIPLQDYLYLGNEARINSPSVLGGNWSWRVDKSVLNKRTASRIRHFAEVYGRI
ncbi:MAG TPA: 4-alpha-glucanotransferase [Lachnospiraceae bacterium]|nr:4-alpha-glucanotransferase [Lachnospiraceae bacterium]